MNILITICARGGSKGVPRKNIRLLNGQPLISYTIRCASRFFENYEGVMALSTDDTSIKKVAADFGLTSDYTRPEFLATDQAGKIGVIKDLLQYEEKKQNLNFDYIIDLDVTSPLRMVSDVQEALEQLIQAPDAFNIFSVSKARRSPYFNMVEAQKNGYYNVVKDTGIILSRQQSPNVFDLDGSIYIYRKKFFDHDFSLPYTPKTLIFQMQHICFDIDEILDLEFMEYLIQNDKLDFQMDY